MKRYHGIDLHASRLTMHTIIPTGTGMEVNRKTMSINTNRLEEDFFPKFDSEDVICVEASGSTAWFVGCLRSQGARVIPINPFDFKAVYETGKKTDKIDAIKLAEHVYEREVLKIKRLEEVHVPQRDIQVLRKTVSLYEFVSKELTALKNQLLAIFRAKCLVFSYTKYLSDREDHLAHRRLDEHDRANIFLLEQLIKVYTDQKAELEQLICQLSVHSREEEIRVLTTIPGISIFVAGCVMADIDTVERFKNPKKMCSYLSSAPKVDKSNLSVKIKGVNKHGRKVAFKMILQSLNHVIDSNTVFMNFAKRKYQGKPPCKIRTALVRKTMVMMFYMLKNKEAYRYIDTRIYERKLKEIKKLSQAA